MSTAADSLLEGNANVESVSAMGKEVVYPSRGVSKLPAILEVEREVTGPSDTVPPVTQCFGTKTKILDDKDMFLELENLGVMIDPKCGGCKCGGCPILGSKYSFSEQKQFDII